MQNENALTFFAQMAQNNPDPICAKLQKNNDFSSMDAEFILQYANSDSMILDLASGTGITINKYYSKVRHITAVEKFLEFSKFIEKSNNIAVYNEDIKTFETENKYDLVLMFGLVSYFNEEEIQELYKKYKKCLKPQGKLIIKNQFGVHKDVIVSGFSQELQKEYFSQYRHTKKEIEILKKLGYKNITITDIYPTDCNRWENTHFYAIVAEAEYVI